MSLKEKLSYNDSKNQENKRFSLIHFRKDINSY